MTPLPPRVDTFVRHIQELTQPKKIHLVTQDESFSPYIDTLIDQGLATPLNSDTRPNSYLFRSHPKDVARNEERTFICTENPAHAGPTNHHVDPTLMREKLHSLFKHCMQGRTLYIIPFCMGPLDSPYAKFGVQLTDSPYVVIHTMCMARVGLSVLEKLHDHPFIPCVHSVGVPNPKPQESWPCNPEQLHIAHFIETEEIWSFGSGYGGNALLGKKCLALRIGSAMAQKQGWLAEHMLILGVTNPQGKKHYIAAAFPSACGKTNLAMLESHMPGWTFETVGDDIAWMHFQDNGRLHAINPEKGFFGVAPGTNIHTNPKAMQAIQHDTLFTNVALTDAGDVWWEGLTPTPPPHLIDWRNTPWTPQSPTPAAHKNARFTVRARQCPSMDPHWQDPQGVPISAIIFGGRRANTIPLVTQATSYIQGLTYGVGLSSEKTSAAFGQEGQLRHDPFAMLPFFGLHFGDYVSHWLSLDTPQHHMPDIFLVNWFQKDENEHYLWPGFQENIRVIQWIFERLEKQHTGQISPLGIHPTPDELNTQGLQICPETLQRLLNPSHKLLYHEFENLYLYLQKFTPQFPQPLLEQILTMKRQCHHE